MSLNVFFLLAYFVTFFIGLYEVFSVRRLNTIVRHNTPGTQEMSNPEPRGLSKISNLVSCRQVLNVMTMLGFMLNCALQMSLTIAILAMVKPNVSISSMPSFNGNSQYLETAVDEEKFPWDSDQQNFLLSSYVLGYILTGLPGGRLADLIGGRSVFGHSMLWTSLLTLFTPIAAHIDYKALVVVIFAIGFMLGASWPAIHPVAAVWIPPLDRSKFMSNMMASSLGAVVTIPICRYFISSFGWASVFYLTGFVGLVWSICWFLFVFDTPAAHPKISAEERLEIEEAIGSSTSKKRPSHVPWDQLLTSPAVWAIIISHVSADFAFFTLINQLPRFMRNVFQFQIAETGLISSLPYLGKYITAVAAAHFADYLRQKGALSTTMTRKVFTTLALFIPGLLMVAQIYLGDTASRSIIIITLALFLHGASTAGYLGNGLDIAPNFSGTIFGVANTLSSLGGFLSTWMVGALTYHDKTYHQWQIVFWVLGATYMSGAFAYVIMGSGELQSWNNQPEKRKGRSTSFEI